MTRQDILERNDRARLWLVLDENVLRRAVGGPALMTRQLRSVVEAAENRRRRSVRDSKNPHGPPLLVPAPAWHAS